MNTPSTSDRAANHLGLSILAARARRAIDRLGAEEQLSEADNDALTDAREFIQNASRGLEFVSQGTTSSAGGLIASVDALGYVLPPIENIQNEDTIATLREILNFLESASAAAPTTESSLREHSSFELARQFFEAFSENLIGAFERTLRERGGSGRENLYQGVY